MRLVVVVLGLLFAACMPPPGVAPAGASVSPSLEAQSRDARPDPQLPRLTATQARATAVVVAFLDAYNAGDLSSALALLTEDVLVSDCDYGKRATVTAYGKQGASAWLNSRIADHDRFVLAELYFGEPNAEGAFAVAVSYERRTSDTLRSLGFPDGIRPRLATKTVVTESGDRLRVFNNGPGVGATIGTCNSSQN